MSKYITSALYTASATDGVAGVASLTPIQLAQTISRAESGVDAYIGFNLLAPNGFAPGTIGVVQHGFDFATRRLRFPSPPVPVRNLKQIRILISQTGTSGVPQYANILPGEVAINNWQGYCEIVALTLTYSTAGVVWSLGLEPPIATWDVETGYYLPVYADTLYDSGNGLLFLSTRAFWAATYDLPQSLQPLTLPPVPANIYINGVLQTTGYTVNYTAGTVTFTASQTGNTITADYTATIPALVAEATMEQVTYLLIQRNLNMIGVGGLEQVRNGQQFARRARTDDAQEDQLCAKARAKLTAYKPIAMG